jgi:hypothetical protein
MTNIQITGLTSSDKFEGNDLMLIRKSGQAVDQNLSATNLIASLGNTAIAGYNVVSNNIDAGNITIKVTPVNGAVITSVVEGMQVCFSSPVSFTGSVKIQINETTYPLLTGNNGTNHLLAENEYIIAVYKGGSFYRKNDASGNAYVNDYVVNSITTSTVSSITTYTIKLDSAYGLKKEAYYDGQHISFILTQDVSTPVKVQVDSLAVVDLFYEINFPVKLYKEQQIDAIYVSSTTAGFRMILDHHAMLTPNFNVVFGGNTDYLSMNRYLDNNVTTYTYIVDDNLSADFTSLAEALKVIDRTFGRYRDDVKIILQASTVSINQTIFINRDLSYITLKPLLNDNKITVKMSANTACFYIVGNGKFLNIQANTTLNIQVINCKGDFITVQNNETQNFEDFNVVIESVDSSSNLYRFLNIIIGNVMMRNVSVTAIDNSSVRYVHAIALVRKASLYLDNVRLKNWGNLALGIGGQVYKNGSVYINAFHEIILRNSDLSKVSTISTSDIFFSGVSGYSTVKQYFSKASCNKTANTSDPAWGQYILVGDNTIQGVDG